MSLILFLVLTITYIIMPKNLGSLDKKVKFSEVFSKNKNINILSASRVFLFGARDVWFVVGLPLFFYSILSDGSVDDNKKAFFIATLTGLTEPIMGFLGVSIVTVFQHFLSIALGFAAGAMLYVISHEIIPESHSRGNETTATFGFIIGLIIMMTLAALSF